MSFEQCRKINKLMENFHCQWFIAGGWAIDLHIGKESRIHTDIEIAIFRKDQLKLKEYLYAWEFKKIISGEFHHWNNEYLNLPIHELHAENKGSKEKIEVLLNETTGDKWMFRRDTRISSPIKVLCKYTSEGIPYLSPEIVLLYKVKNTREKDYRDFMTVSEYLTPQQRRWLIDAIQIHEPQHEWLEYLIEVSLYRRGGAGSSYVSIIFLVSPQTR